MHYRTLKLQSSVGMMAAVSLGAALTLTLAPAMTGAHGGATASAVVRKIGPVTGLAAAVTKPAAAYRVAATWNALSGATSYRLALTDSTGATLASGTVTGSTWTASTTKPAGTRVTVKVTPLASKRPGRVASITKVLPDLTAPTGTYHLVQVGGNGGTGGHVDVTQDTLSDDSGTAGITRSIDWGDNGGWVSWGSGTTVSHDYSSLSGVHYPQVKLVDQALNEAIVPLHVVVVGDTANPTGTFDVAPLTGWAKLTRVQVTQTALHDDLSTAQHIARMVNWNDGTPLTAWLAGTTLSHVYQTGGPHTPTVQLTDEAENAAAPIVLQTVTSNVDAVAPRVTQQRPATQRGYVSRWKTLKGTATDTSGTGVRRVTLRIVEKRGTAWYAYRATTHTWVKAATKAGAVRKSTAASVTPNALHRWAYRLPGLRKGSLLVWRTGTDMVGNTSAASVLRQVLNHR
jgi:hypothetical protein